ncbi:MAG: type I-C CRISPR-associated protein Cas8c/Csd1 [bacterium]
MILQALNDLYDRLASDPAYEIAPPGFSPQKISFRIVIKLDGSLVAIEDARTLDQKGKLQNTVMLVPGDAKPSGAGINPGLLWDNQTYLLGRQPEDKPAGFGIKRFEALRVRHLECETQINDPVFSGVCRFLENWIPDRIPDFPVLNEVGTGFGIFQIQGEKKPVHELPSFQTWWLKSSLGSASDKTSQCLISGTVRPIAILHPKIKGVTGSQAAGASLVSFNARAYESYGKTDSQGLNSPVGEELAFQYGTALNSLLTGPCRDKHRLRIGDTTVVFWTEKPTIVEDIFAEIFSGGFELPTQTQDASRQNQIKLLLEAIRSGSKFQDVGNSGTAFFILGLAPNAARVSVRFFHRSTIEELLGKLHAHHKCIEMVRQFPEAVGKRLADPEFPAVWQILRETARDVDDIPPLLGGALTRSIIEGTPYPEALFSAIIRRIQADREINYLRAATLKAILIRNHNQNIPTMLDPTNTTPSYLLGRLFAALEKTQEDALGGNINAGIRDRFYSAASATPASVFPRLIRTYQHHLSKLNSGAKVNRDRLVQDILATLDAAGFPNQLSLKNQGIFAIGYYHQRKDFFTKKETAETTQN